MWHGVQDAKSIVAQVASRKHQGCHDPDDTLYWQMCERLSSGADHIAALEREKGKSGFWHAEAEKVVDNAVRILRDGGVETEPPSIEDACRRAVKRIAALERELAEARAEIVRQGQRIKAFEISGGAVITMFATEQLAHELRRRMSIGDDSAHQTLEKAELKAQVDALRKRLTNVEADRNDAAEYLR